MWLYKIALAALLLVCATPLPAAEGPFFVTYTSQLEEQGNLEIETSGILGQTGSGPRFGAGAIELEYGVLGWWTTEAYFDGQSTGHEGSLFTGWRLENRFRAARREHWINPVFYLEFEDVNAADKTLLEVVGHDGEADLRQPNGTARLEKKRELESKLLVSSHWRSWNISENITLEKNLAHAPWEFGYAAGVYRPLALEARPDPCTFCRENFTAGVEFYGGLGDTGELTLRATSHYAAPVLSWTVTDGIRLKISPAFGISDASAPFLLRVGVSYEIPQFGRRLRRS